MAVTKTVADYMTTQLITADEGMGIRAAYFLMREHHIRHLVVVDIDNHLIGLVSDRELRRPDWVDEDPDTSHIYDLSDDLALGDVMVREVYNLHPEDNLNRAVRLMVEKKYSSAPVLDENQCLVGILSTQDLLHAFHDHLQADS